MPCPVGVELAVCSTAVLDRYVEISCDELYLVLLILWRPPPLVTALQTLLLIALRTGSGDPIGSYLRGSDGREVGPFVMYDGGGSVTPPMPSCCV